jgi:uncharacterized membrane protein
VTVTSSFLLLLLAMAAASFACRAGGFLAMRFIPRSPRLDAALRATPAAVMAGIAAMAAMNGGIREIVALAVVMLTMRLTGNDLVAALAGVALLALSRQIAF